LGVLSRLQPLTGIFFAKFGPSMPSITDISKCK
jgi:hypothetical protein